MTGLLIALGLALATTIAIFFAARLSLAKLAPLATALLLGLAGYAWQGSPGLAGKPVKAASTVKFDEALAQKRRDLGERISRATAYMVMSDSFGARGETKEAANAVVLGLRKYPDDSNLWVGLGNALMVHANGNLTPASEYAFRQAMTLQPKGISPQYFYGLALAESGKFEAARAIWLELAARLPESMDLREELIRNIALLQALIKRQDDPSQSGNQPQ